MYHTVYSRKRCKTLRQLDQNVSSKKYRRIKTIDAHSSYDSESDSSEDSQLDFNEELHPIGYYVKDRAAMINEMFKVIHGKKLRAMLPPLLKGYSVDELKFLCLEELLGMSEKRILSILEGRELDTSSESEVLSSESEAEEMIAKEDCKDNWCNDAEVSSTTKTGENDRCDMDTLEIGITREEMGELLNDMCCGETSRKKRPMETRCEKPWKLNKLETTDSFRSKLEASEDDTSQQGQEREDYAFDKEDNNNGKTLLEILELEMRARAIRALLKQQGEDEVVSLQGNTESETKMEKQSAEEIVAYIDKQSPHMMVRNMDKKNIDAITRNMALNEIVSINTKERSSNSIIKKDDINPQPSRRFKKTSGNVKNKNINTIVLSGSDNDKFEMDLVSTKIEVVDLTKEKLDAMEVTPSAGKPSNPVLCSQNEKTFSIDNERCTTSKTFEVQNKTVCENRTPLDKAKRRCYRSNQEEGEISSDDEYKSDTAHTVKIESESDFDVITLDDSNDSIRSLPQAERHVTIENLNLSKLTSVNGAANQRKYNEILRSNLKVYVKNKGQLKTRDTLIDVTSTQLSKNPKIKIQKSLEEIRDDDIEAEDSVSDMTWTARWLKSKGVQRVVETSKVCAKMRKRIKSAHKKPQVTFQDTTEESQSPLRITGSVKEYRMLDKPKGSDKHNVSDEKQ